jgi:methanogenic corrinoid protein MtbC1
MKTPHLGIKHVAALTGLSAHVIRIWERRYGAVEPVRTDSNRRVYGEEHVERLRLLRALTEAGQSIGLIAKLPTARLRTLLSPDRNSVVAAEAAMGAKFDVGSVINQSVTAIRSYDAPALEALVAEAEIALGLQGLLQKMVAPLAVEIGELWRRGEITAAHEHFATGVLGMRLKQTSRVFGGAENAPVLVVATPEGQLHELGALLVAASAGNLGWRVTYLGASLPAAEIAGAARKLSARAVALSIVYPEADSRIDRELQRLRKALPLGVGIIVGGRAADFYRGEIDKHQARFCSDLAALGLELDRLQRERSSAAN